MTVETFFANFGYLADAPNGVQKLRELILQLAVQGKLVPQDPDDDPASVLLERIEGEKKRLVKEKIIRKANLIPIASEDESYELPSTWEWVRFGSIAQHNAGKTLDKGRNTGQLRDYITTSNLYWGHFDLNNVRQMPIEDEELERCTAKAGDLLIVEGGEAGRAAVWTEDYEVCFQNHVHRARFYCDIDPFYVYRFFEKLNLSGEISQYRKGVGISNMSGKALASIVLPLPPLEEQKRIVAKVDQLMVLCDELEARQQKQQQGRVRLNNAALDALLTARESDEFADRWQRISTNFDLLYDHPETIAKLRAAILQLAVQGKLVTQDTNEGATRNVTMEELVGRKNLKNGLSLSQVDRPSNFACLPLAAMKGSTIDCSIGKPIEISADRAEPYLIKPRDIFIIRGNGNKDRVGIAGMARSCPPNVLFPDLFIRVTLPLSKIDGEYFLIVWNSPVTRKVLEELAATTSGIWKVNQGHISECEIPLPPLEEQKRIVAKVDQLMALCDELEAKLNQARQHSEKLMEATVRQVLADTNRKGDRQPCLRQTSQSPATFLKLMKCGAKEA